MNYRHPRIRRRPGRPPPRAIAVTIERFRRDFESRSGPLWDHFRSALPARYAPDGRWTRERSLRSDGADTMLCVITTLLSCMDLRRGFVARPPAVGEGRWHRRTVAELFGFAFGRPVAGRLGPRRIERALRALAAIGAIQTQQIRRRERAGIRSEAAVRLVGDRLFRLAGTIGQLQMERRRAFERAAEQSRAAQASRAIETVRLPMGPRSATTATAVTSTATRAREGPPRPIGDLLAPLFRRKS